MLFYFYNLRDLSKSIYTVFFSTVGMGIYCCFFVPSNLLLSSGHSNFYILGCWNLFCSFKHFRTLFWDSIFISKLTFKLYVVSGFYPGANLSPLLSDCLLKTLLNVMYYGIFFLQYICHN